MIRAFLAVELGEDLRGGIARIQGALKRALAKEDGRTMRVAWVNPAMAHLTVKFLGGIDESQVEPLRSEIAGLLAERRPVRVPFERTGAFPADERPRVLWVGAPDAWVRGADGARLAALVRAVDDCASAFGVARDARPFSPHITLGRVKEGERQLARALARTGVLHRESHAGSLIIDAVALMRSDTQPSGAVYTKLWEARVGPA